MLLVTKELSRREQLESLFAHTPMRRLSMRDRPITNWLSHPKRRSRASFEKKKESYA